MVIVVIGVLAAILMPVAGQLREGAMNVRCIGNLRMVGIALNAYADEHQQLYPPTFSSVRNPPNKNTWMTAVETYAGYPPKSSGGAPKPRAMEVFYCPKMTEEDRSGRRVGYFYNTAVTGVTVPRRSLSLQTFLVIEGSPANSDSLRASAFLANPPKRHPMGAVNFLCVDGRVETLRPPFDEADPRWSPAGNE